MVLWLVPRGIGVSVTEGVVTLAGQTKRRSETEIAVSMTRQIDGVVAVLDKLTWRLEDPSAFGRTGAARCGPTTGCANSERRRTIMATNVLVTYGTTNGSTAEIAQTIAEVLRKDGLAVEALPTRSVSSAASYDAVVVGGGLYAGRWHKDARRFVRRHREALSKRPLWFFSSGPLDASASERDVPPVPWVKKAMARLDAREHVTFGGCLQEGAKGWVARMILRDGRGGDFRNFDQIEAWAARIGHELTI